MACSTSPFLVRSRRTRERGAPLEVDLRRVAAHATFAAMQGSRLGRFLVAALALHLAALVWAFLLGEHESKTARIPHTADPTQFDVEVILEPRETWEQGLALEERASRTREESPPRLPEAVGTRSDASPAGTADETASDTSALPANAMDEEGANKGAVPSETPDTEGSSLSTSSSSSQPSSSAPNNARPRGGGKAISLADAGFGERTPLILAPGGADATAFAEDRLERSMAQAALDEDRSIGLGSHALITTAINQVATGLAPPRSKARMSVIADADGRIVAIEILEVDRDFGAWRKVADKTMTTLVGKRLTHKLARATRMVFEVESKVQLPSGRAPGANVTVLGIPIQSSGDEESTQVKILSPEVKVEMVEVLDPAESGGKSLKIPVPMIKMTVVGVDGDLVDIAAPARQVVHTRLVKQDVL